MAINTIDLDEIGKFKDRFIQIQEATERISGNISKEFEGFAIDSPEITQAKNDLAARNNSFSQKCANVVSSLTSEITTARSAISSAGETVAKTISSSVE